MHPQRHARASTSLTRCKNPEPFQMVFPHVIVFFSYYRFSKRWLRTLIKEFTWARKGKRKRKSKGRERKKERKGRRKGEEKEKKAVSHTDHFWCQKLSFSLPFCYRSWILCMFLFSGNGCSQQKRNECSDHLPGTFPCAESDTHSLARHYDNKQWKEETKSTIYICIYGILYK